MDKDKCFYFASIVRPYGVNGAVIIKMEVDDPSYYKKITSCFVDIEGNFIEYKVSSIQLRDKEFAVIQFDHCKSEDDTELLVDRDIYLPQSLLPKLEGNKFYFHEIIGFKVIDLEYGDIGIVNRVLDMPRQDIIEILSKPNDILIPITDEIIISVDRDERQVRVNAPAGLIELYRTT